MTEKIQEIQREFECKYLHLLSDTLTNMERGLNELSVDFQRVEVSSGYYITDDQFRMVTKLVDEAASKIREAITVVNLPATKDDDHAST